MGLDLAQEFLKDEIDINQGRPLRSRRHRYSKPKERELREVEEKSYEKPVEKTTGADSRSMTSAIRHDNPLLRQEKNQWISGQAPYSDTYMLTKMDTTLSRLDEIQRDIDRLRAGIGTELAEIEKWQGTVEEMKQGLTNQIDDMSDRSVSKTLELARSLDISMGRLATKKSAGRANILLGVTLFISLVNTVGIVLIVLIILGIIR